MTFKKYKHDYLVKALVRKCNLGWIFTNSRFKLKLKEIISVHINQ